MSQGISVDPNRKMKTECKKEEKRLTTHQTRTRVTVPRRVTSHRRDGVRQKKNKRTNSRNDGKNNKRDQTECTATHDVKSTDRRGRARGRLSPRSDITKYLEKARSISSKRPRPDSPTLDLNQRPLVQEN
ncbi:hypothetical protein ElyMa_000004800 [Elysia marginata]|uniref:MBD domain-containing protein n=1 Tax=Elysia marginata TaxID=1093978 RepID=A0AAV4E925_9GAST|nr:hypothetical protein ElyMa_000004800 [Elysia marginata]